jgi:hypothetical protein
MFKSIFYFIIKKKVYGKAIETTIKENEGKNKYMDQTSYDLIFTEYSVIKGFHSSLLNFLEKLLEEDKNNKQPTLTLVKISSIKKKGQIFLKFVIYI